MLQSNTMKQNKTMEDSMSKEVNRQEVILIYFVEVFHSNYFEQISLC